MRPAAYGVRGKVPSLFQERMLFVHAWFMTGRHAPSFQSAFLIVLFLLLLPFLWFSWIFRFCVSCSCVLLFVDSSSGFL